MKSSSYESLYWVTKMSIIKFGSIFNANFNWISRIIVSFLGVVSLYLKAFPAWRPHTDMTVLGTACHSLPYPYRRLRGWHAVQIRGRVCERLRVATRVQITLWLRPHFFCYACNQNSKLLGGKDSSSERQGGWLLIKWLLVIPRSGLTGGPVTGKVPCVKYVVVTKVTLIVAVAFQESFWRNQAR